MTRAVLLRRAVPFPGANVDKRSKRPASERHALGDHAMLPPYLASSDVKGAVGHYVTGILLPFRSNRGGCEPRHGRGACN